MEPSAELKRVSTEPEQYLWVGLNYESGWLPLPHQLATALEEKYISMNGIACCGTGLEGACWGW